MSGEVAPVRVFRVKYGIRLSSNGSTGDWKLYDNVQDMKRELLVAWLEVADKDRDVRGTKNWTRKWFCRAWRNHLKGTEDYFPRASQIFAVEQFVEGEWVEITPEFVEPEVHLVGVR